MSKEKLHNEEALKDDSNSKIARETGQRTGVGNQPMDEKHPRYDMAENEQVLSGDSNQRIIFGKDRPNNRASGYGGRGSTGANRIDLLVGLASAEGPLDENEIRNPSFQNDAARLYISEKSDIDKAMGLAPSSDAKARSAIGMKADEIRMNAVGNVKITTSTTNNRTQNSADGSPNEKPGVIEFIAGNFTGKEKKVDLSFLDSDSVRNLEEKLQPVPKGLRLSSLLETMIDLQSEITQEIQDLIQILIEMNIGLGAHIHAPAPIVVTGPSPTYAPMAVNISSRLGTKLANIALLQSRFELLKTNYLQSTGSRYINSNYVKTT